MKLTNQQKTTLNDILSNIVKAAKYIKKDDVILGRINKSPNSCTFINSSGTGIDVVNKDIGSEICYLYNAIEKLKNFIEQQN